MAYWGGDGPPLVPPLTSTLSSPPILPHSDTVSLTLSSLALSSQQLSSFLAFITSSLSLSTSTSPQVYPPFIIHLLQSLINIISITCSISAPSTLSTVPFPLSPTQTSSFPSSLPSFYPDPT